MQQYKEWEYTYSAALRPIPLFQISWFK